MEQHLHVLSSPVKRHLHFVMAILLLLVLVGTGGWTLASHRAHASSNVQINSGGGNVSPFVADTDYSGGKTYQTSDTIDTSGVTNPAPQAVYQSERYGNFTYTVTGLSSGSSYTVRLHFAEIYWDASGKRVFNASINGTQVLSNFDIYATVGKDKAIVKEFSATADSSGQITIQYSTVTDNAKSSGIEVIAASSGGGGNCGSASGGPTDNPVTGRYGSGTYSWTDNIKWSCVYNVNDYSGSDMDKFNAARDAAYANGGGVVYFPSGTYNFSDDMYLKNGVVIRGDAPSTTDATSSSFVPPSHLVFPQYVPTLSGSGTDNSTAFKKIYTTNPKSDSNIGVVNLDINRAGVSLTYTSDNTETNQDVLVFGVRTNNVGSNYSAVVPTSFQNAWQRWMNVFECNINVQAYANVLVAETRNNDISQAGNDDSYDQPGYIIEDKSSHAVITLTDGSKARFDYANHYGINVNRNVNANNIYGATPDQIPGLFRTGIVVRDNWVYNTMRVGYIVSGQGLQVLSNVKTDKTGKTYYVYPTGQYNTQGTNTFENRGIDWSGHDVLIDGNHTTVYQGRIGDGPYYSVDGEGILIQACCGGSDVNGVTISNNVVNSYIGQWDMPKLNNVTIRGNTLNDNAYIISWSESTGDNITIDGNTFNNDQSITLKVHDSSSGNSITNNVSVPGTGYVQYTTAANPTISGNSGFTNSVITY